MKAQDVAVLALREAILRLDISQVSIAIPGRLEMIPIYSISARNIVLGKWNRGWRGGWRYFWTHERLELGITVEVRRGADNQPHLASVSTGMAAPAISAQLAQVCKKLANDPNRYRPRILRLPWISLEAIWFNTDSLDIPDHFINRAGILHGEKFLKQALHRSQDFLRSHAAALVGPGSPDGGVIAE